ncbi:leucine-rich repeat neuronal protein 1-like [Chelonus insularis]|uniref:leucine-rich repeat neuronal protein 1-like n=1 Tax=Chelonus insularis TaxID=460826 RepID=UPI001588E579|nr:leucine-rich repeat neuronal protein 1-like [Chelonus insularis]
MWKSVCTLILAIIFDVQSTMVDLSYRNLQKEQFFVTIQPQINLHNVTDLNLKGNCFDSFLDCSTNLNNLKTLDLAENRLQRFFFLCNDEYNLEYLNVSHNELEYIDDNALNNRVPKLKILDLSWNKITVINETMLEHMKILEFLSVAHNPVIDIHERAFLHQKNLLHLDMSNISTSFFPSSLFKPMTNLKFLNISFNPIETIPFLPINLMELDISGTHVLYLDSFILPRLTKLHINYMPFITEVLLNDFENLTLMEHLSIENCQKLSDLRVWPPNTRILPRLRFLSVKGCSLETLTDDLRPIMQRTSVVNLQNNPWHCDCRMQWVNRLNLSSELSAEIRCKSPEEHEGKLLIKIPTHDLKCVEFLSAAYPALWASISILILALILTGIYLFWKGPLKHWTLPKRGSDSVSYKNVKESSNDLIRILVTDDRADE